MWLFILRAQIDEMAPYREESNNGSMVIDKQSIAGGRDLVVLADGTGNQCGQVLQD